MVPGLVDLPERGMAEKVIGPAPGPELGLVRDLLGQVAVGGTVAITAEIGTAGLPAARTMTTIIEAEEVAAEAVALSPAEVLPTTDCLPMLTME